MWFDAGGIYNRGTLALNNCTVSGNTAGNGGGIYNSGNLTLNRSTVEENATCNGDDGDDGGHGGGIYNWEGDLTLTSSTVSGNHTGAGGSGSGDGGDGGDGGGIYNQGDLTLTDSTVSDNSTGDGSACTGVECEGGHGGYGGGIYNQGDLTLTDSTVSDNSTGDGGACTGDNCMGGYGGYGGGVYNQGDLTLTGSTLSGNGTGSGGDGEHEGDDGYGGGLCSSGSNPTLTNVTISGNTAAGHGGGIYHREGYTLTLTNCTITDNTADSDNDGRGDGGGICRDSGTVNFKNTILAGNTDPTSAPDCAGTLTSQDYNLVGDNSGCTFTPQTHDQVGTGVTIDPKLGPLANNGGPTETHALLTGSPALEYIPPISCTVATDQRGVTRPQPTGGNCDIGAYEAAAPPTAESTDSVGIGQDTYTVAETVYGTGSGFIPDTNVDVYIVGDRAWNDGDAIPADVSGDGMNPGVPTDATGNLGPADVWPPPLTPGEYDMVFDANQNGVYDAAIDVVDDPNHPGFVVQRAVPVGGVILPVNKLGLLVPWLGLAALASLAVFTVALVRRRRSA
jgi:parallel beta-helix repeat protein